MLNAIRFLQSVFSSDKLRRITASIDMALNGRSLDVDTAVVSLTTGPENYGFWSHEPYPFFTRDVKRFMVLGQTAFGSWDRSDALALDRGGSQYLIMYPDAVTRVGKLDYDVSCTSTLGKLTQVGHKGGIYDAGTQTTAGALMREICGYVNGQPTIGVTLYVAPEFENIVLYGWLPYLSPTGENGSATGSARDNFLQVLFAINACLRDDENGVLRVENLPTEAQSSITADRMYRNNARVVTKQSVTSVTLLEHNYIVGSDTKILFDGTSLASQTIVFSGPMSELSWHTTAEPPVEMTILEQGANYAVLSAGTGVLTGTPYVDTSRELTTVMSNSDTQNTERITEATLISTTNGPSVLEKLVSYYSHRSWIECDAQIEHEDAGDVVSIWDPFDEIMRSACIERISPLVVSGVMKGRISALIGYTPYQTAEFTDKRRLLVGNGTFTVPDGVTHLTVIMFSSGGGGEGGVNGSDGTRNTFDHVQNENSSFGVAAGVAGAGGAGGKAGTQGKILYLDLTVTPGSSFIYSCGAASTGGSVGTAGAEHGGAGQALHETSFGTYSTETGSAPGPNGYYDAPSDTYYALPGKDGVDGGAGGDGGLNRNGKDGKTVSSSEGGAGGVSFNDSGSSSAPPQASWNHSNGGGGGGGAAYGRGGNAGENGASAWSYDETTNTSYLYGGGGGNGGAAKSAPQATSYGSAGNGGNGGGGGGGAGGFNYSRSGSGGEYVRAVYSPSAGQGGAGTAGGTGAAGCIILYYREPVT